MDWAAVSRRLFWCLAWDNIEVCLLMVGMARELLYGLQTFEVAQSTLLQPFDPFLLTLNSFIDFIDIDWVVALKV